MIEIQDKRNCTGCGACINACPLNIIKFEEDEEGFTYPYIDTGKCINCHLCEKSCPMLQERSSLCLTIDGFPQFYAGQLVKKEDLLAVSSGGAFWAFSQTIIDKGGVVYGAVQENVDEIFHYRANDKDGINLIRRSKYFQSDTRTTMIQVKDDLKNGLIVLYSGTGCQIAGLKAYLGKDYSNLFTCEVVCHGVPSRKVWKKYREEKERQEGKEFQELIFRDKSAGWSHNQYKITYADGTIEKEPSPTQLFHAGYLSGLFYRPSCGTCRFASLPRVADITLADYWQYRGKYKQMGGDFGVSLITVNNAKGEKLLKKSSNYLDFEDTDRKLAISSCKHLDEHPTENPNRRAFFKLFKKSGYYVAANKYIKNRDLIQFLRSLIKRIYSMKLQKL